MIGLLCFVMAVLASPFKSKSRLEAENAVLRHQLVILRRKMQGRAHLTKMIAGFYPDVSMAPVNLKGCCDHTPREACSWASRGLSHLLAVEIARICTESYVPMRAIITASERTGH